MVIHGLWVDITNFTIIINMAAEIVGEENQSI